MLNKCSYVRLGRHFALFFVLYCLCISVCLSNLYVKEILTFLLDVRKEDLMVALRRLTDDQICLVRIKLSCHDAQISYFDILSFFLVGAHREPRSPKKNFCSVFFTVGPQPIVVKHSVEQRQTFLESTANSFKPLRFPASPSPTSVSLSGSACFSLWHLYLVPINQWWRQVRTKTVLAALTITIPFQWSFPFRFFLNTFSAIQ